MSQHTAAYQLPGSPLSGASGLPLINSILAAIQSCNSGPTAPPNPVAAMMWMDTSTTPWTLRQRNDANTAWVVFLPPDLSIGTTKLADGAVTGPKMATAAVARSHMATMLAARIMGRSVGSAGSPSDLTAAQVWAILAAAGVVQPWQFTSADLAYTDGGTVTVAHGLGAKPTRWQVTVVCLAADAGAAVGDEIALPHLMQSESSYGATATVTATQAIVRIASSGLLNTIAGSGGSPMSPANWAIKVRASL